MLNLVTAILLMVNVWTTPDGVQLYAPHFREAPGGAIERATELAGEFLLAEEAYGVDRNLVAALAFNESGFDASRVGTLGEFTIMQLHPHSAWGRAARTLCRDRSRCERAAVLEAARLLALGLQQCGSEARAIGFYKTGRCVSGPAAGNVLDLRDRMRQLGRPYVVSSARW